MNLKKNPSIGFVVHNDQLLLSLTDIFLFDLCCYGQVDLLDWSMYTSLGEQSRNCANIMERVIESRSSLFDLD